MKETEDIIRLFHLATNAGKQTALATVVLVEGSSYRRPGARMLITEDGEITGTISGGCLETDAIRKGLLSISQQQNKLVAYNSMDDEDITDGIQLGCNGIVYILFEPVNAGDEFNPVALLEKTLACQHPAALVTVFNKKQLTAFQQGTMRLLVNDRQFVSSRNGLIEGHFKEQIQQALLQQKSIKHFASGENTVFVNVLQPAISLVIAGAGNDAFPLVKFANTLGWKVTIADGRKTYANVQRFGDTATIIVGKPAEVVSQLTIHERSAFVLLTHNYNYDIAMLALLMDQPCSYIGVLGPKKKKEKMLEELRLNGLVIVEKELAKIFGPAGLDIGAETPEEIALSIIAEIKAVMANRAGGTLRDKNGFIHDHEKPETFSSDTAESRPHFPQQIPTTSCNL